MSCLEMKCLSGIWKRILMLFAVFFVMMVSLPAYAERLPDFLAKVQPSEIFPGADRYGKPEGKPLVARVYKGEEQLGLVYITTDVVNTRGYSSKPIDTMVALANDGTIAGAKLVEHHEPIMLIGIPQSRVDKFIDKYIGLNFIKNPPQPGVAPGDIISGATVTLMVINDSIQRSVKAVIHQYHLGTDKAVQAGTAAASGDQSEPVKSRSTSLPIKTNKISCHGMRFWNKKPSVICIFLSTKSINCLRKAVKQVWQIMRSRAMVMIHLLICMLPWSANLPSVKAF